MLPVTKEVLAELRSLPDHGPDKFAFSIRDGRTARTLGKWERRKLYELSDTSDWTYHDIRRTVRTKLAELGIPDEVAERVISHTPGKLMRTYNQHAYAKEKREALERWAKHLAKLVSDDIAKARRTVKFDPRWVNAARRTRQVQISQANAT
jgi:hypothetical protein